MIGRSIRIGVRAVTAGSAVPAVYLATVSVAAFLPRPARPPNRPRTRFAVLVPAHDEAAGIAATLTSLRDSDYPADMFSVHVVADNCTDDTAGVVRAHGFTAHERDDADHPGKGPALNWLRDRLIDSGETFDAAVVVDADTSVASGFLRAADAAVQAGLGAGQGYYAVRQPDSAASVGFRATALACRHFLRPLGRTRFGASAGLYGNGMVFSRAVLVANDWTGHLVEDAELQNELLLGGTKVTFIPDAVVYAEMPDDLAAARGQNARWERGRVELARRYVPRLARRVVTGPDRVAAADAVLDHLTPPVSVVVGGHLAGASFGLVARRIDARTGRAVLATHVVGLALVAGHVVSGLVAVRAPARQYLRLLHAPRQVLWKVALWASVATGRERAAWTRTRRNVEAR